MARIIAMDEMGNFEKRDKGVRLLGGYVLEGEYQEEKDGIEEFLNELCDKYTRIAQQKFPKCKIKYPKSLHGSGALLFEPELKGGEELWIKMNRWNLDKNTRDSVSEEENKIWNDMQLDVLEYLKNRNCKLFMYLDPYTGGGFDENPQSTSNITNVQHAANRYERMALQAIYQQVFYSLQPDAKEYIFELATRSLPLNKENEIYDKEEYDKLYFDNNGNAQITNTSTYKTAISTMLYEKSIFNDAKYEFNVKPINYDMADTKPTTPFLYIADIICSYMKKMFVEDLKVNLRVVDNQVSSDDLINMVKDNSENNLEIFVYSKADVIYRKMVEAIKNHRIVDYYGYLYEMMELKDDVEEENVQGCMTLETDNVNIRTYKKFYLENWIEGLNKSITDKLEKDDNEKRIFRSMINDYVAYVEGYMGSREISYEKGFFIAEKLLGHVEAQSQWKNQFKILFKLYDIKLRGYNHRGSIDNVRLCAEKCNLYKAYVSTEEYVLHILRVIEYYLNSFRFNEALEESSRLIKVGEKLEDTYKEVYSTSEEVAKSILGDVNPVQSGQLTIVGKIYSNLGQVYAFLRDYENSRKMFEKALEKFSIGTDDYKITQSYYLHLFIDNNKMHEYNKESVFYFGSDNIKEQLLNAVEYNAYAIYVFIKAYRKFYVQDYLNRDILEDIISIISSIDSSRRTSHPWELIYKNLSECLLIAENANTKKKIEYTELADKYAAKCQACNQNADTTIDLIQINAKLEFMNMKGMIKEEGVVENLDAKEIRNCEKFLNCEAPIRYKQLKQFLDDKITYMYR